METVETHWRNATGTNVLAPPVSPVFDMDIDGIQENTMDNEWLRERASRLGRS
jgi:hypothetical protein